MKGSRIVILVGLCLPALGLALSLMATGLALAQEGAAIDWWVFGNAGGPASSGGEIIIDATLGQPVIGPASAEKVSLGAGYWYEGGEPTAVTLAWFKATPVGDNILVEWETATEIDTLGFNLYRSESPTGPSTKLNASLIPAQSPGAPIGAAYAWPDEAVEPGLTYYYWLEDVGTHGIATQHGPVSVRVSVGGEYRVYLPLVER